jgi:6-phosphogluconolactonase
MKPKRIVTEDPGAAAGRLVVEALGEGGALALSGGTAPVPLLRWLVDGLPAAVARRSRLTWVDERHVPAEGPWEGWSPESNRRLAWEHWLSRVEARPAEIPLDAPGPLADARQAVEQRYRREIDRLDVAVLGVGPDGHVASLFPGRPELEAEGTVLAVTDSPKPPPERLTLSRGEIERARRLILLASGSAKASVVARAFTGDRSLPLGRLEPEGEWIWVLDPAAAAELPVDGATDAA